MAGEFNGRYQQQQQQQGGNGMMMMMPMMGNYYNNPPPPPGGGGTSLVNDVDIFSLHHHTTNNYNPSSSSIPTPVPVLKHDTGLAVEWTVAEQIKLEEGLSKYANEPNIMRYIKIAALFHDKTVRDVALRCRWMTSKRRKQEDQISVKKGMDRKDILMKSSLKNDMSSASLGNAPPYSLTTNHHHQLDYMLSGVPNCTAKHLLVENNQAFGQISTNLSTLKLQENINLFSHTRNNLITILNEMRNTPGIMSRMPPLPVLLNEELASSIFPHSSQPMMFGPSSFIHLKQEPGC